MKYTVSIALLAAGAQAFPQMNGMAMSKRGMQGSGDNGGRMGNSGYTGTVDQDVKAQALQAHNDGRAAYGVPLLEWDDQLAASAQGWANEIGSNMQHSGHNGYGENLAWNTRGNVRDMILSQWFDECKDYRGGFSEAAGHYSQCVWRATKKVGCGFNRQKMLVCQYYPPGNFNNDYARNVPQGRCINAAGLRPGSGGNAPVNNGPGYQAPAGGDQSPAPATPDYGSGGQAPAPSQPSYGNGGQAPSRGHGGRPKPAPKPVPAPDCDEDDSAQSPQHGGHGRRPVPRPAPRPVYQAPAPQQAPSRGQRPHRGQAPDEDCDDEDQSAGHGRGPRPYGGDMGSGPSRGGNWGGDYGRNGSGPSRGGNGGYGGRGSSGGHGGDDSDCED